jgi:hypothetical protein
VHRTGNPVSKAQISQQFLVGAMQMMPWTVRLDRLERDG